MTEPVSTADEAVLQRRRFLRGSALLAAAAGGAVAATAGGVLPASASPSVEYAATFAVPPTRVFDTKTELGEIVGSSPSALTGKNRLRQGAWIDVALVPGDAFPLVALFVNLTSYSSLKSGSLVVSTGEEKPSGTTLSHAKGQTVSNSAIVGWVGPFGPTNRSENFFVVRVFASATTHVSLDVTGASVYYTEGDPSRTSPDAQAKQLVTALNKVR